MEENREVKREKVRSIPIEQIEDFPEHPFKIQNDEQMQKLIESIQDYGVITPVVARRIGEERYELISGHRRKYACKRLGIDRLPVIVRDLSRDEAVITMHFPGGTSKVPRLCFVPASRQSSPISQMRISRANLASTHP